MLNPHVTLEGGYATGIIIFATLVVVLSMCVSFVACKFFGPARSDPRPPRSTPYVRATSVRMWVRDTFSSKKLRKSWQVRVAKISNANSSRCSQSELNHVESPTENHVMVRGGDEKNQKKGPTSHINVAYTPIPESTSYWNDMDIEETSHEIFV